MCDDFDKNEIQNTFVWHIDSPASLWLMYPQYVYVIRIYSRLSLQLETPAVGYFNYVSTDS